MNTIPVHLTDEEAKTFVVFQKHRDIIDALDKAGFFTLKGGSIEIHVDPNGKVREVWTHTHLRA